MSLCLTLVRDLTENLPTLTKFLVNWIEGLEETYPTVPEIWYQII